MTSLFDIGRDKPPEPPPLRPYQQQAVDRITAKLGAGAKGVLFVLATGGGKTRTFSHIAMVTAQRRRRVWIFVHRRELLNQGSRSLWTFGVAHGLIAPGRAVTPELVQVASIDTVLARLDSLRPLLAAVDLAVIDEAHHATATKWRRVAEAMPQAQLLGVTATPYRTDGTGLGEIFADSVEGPSIRELIDIGALVEPLVFSPPVNIDLSKVKNRGGDYATADLVKAVDTAEITLGAVEHYRRLCDGQPAVAFCASVEHAQHVAEQFARAGYRAASVDGGMGERERDAAISGLGDGRLQVLTSCDLISEGTDIPVVSAAILLRPTQSTGLLMQQIGRVLRPSPGKSHALVIDQVGNVHGKHQHGLPDEKRPWSLRGGIKGLERAVAATRRCRRCYRVHGDAPACASCGKAYPVPKPRTTAPEPPMVMPSEVAMALTEISDDRLRAMPLKSALKIALTEADLKRVAMARGYKAGWVGHILAERSFYRRAG